MSDSLSDNARASLAKVIEQFKTGNLGPLVEVITLRHKGIIPFSRWSLSNQLMAYVQTGGSTDCRTFNQWKAVGRIVKKGERAAYILGPVTVVVDKGTEDERVIVKGFRGIAVFAYEQTEGDPLGEEQEEHFTPDALPPLMGVAERLGVAVKYMPTVSHNAYGWFSSGKGEIVLGTHDWSTFFHELAHAAHNKIEKLKGGQDIDQEVVAEFTAVVLGQMYGLDYTGNAWRYITHYAPNDPLRAVVRCLSTVEKVIDLIIGVEEKEKELVMA